MQHLFDNPYFYEIAKEIELDPIKERFINDEEANKMLSRTQRKPYGTNYIKM